ncbi:ABC transporter permease [Krasilnikovia sp. M28-CT-15]|uniref:ABC transporter permease n=1 Tax=Krasilnikovia sp. M28-CT-15 TaxID=3373540 RepID=UPI00399CECF3
MTAAPTARTDGAAIPSPRRTARRRHPLRWTIRIASLVGALLLWQWLTTAEVTVGVRFDRLPTPAAVGEYFAHVARDPVYYEDIAQSLVRILTGFALAAVAGVAAGVAVARSWLLSDVLEPLFEVIRPIPAIALVPIAILLFPRNEQGIVFITFTAAFFPIMVSTRHAVRALPTVWEDAVRTMGGGRWRVLTSVVLPGALPGVFSGLSVGIGVSWICVISAEMISGDFGVGYRTWHAYTIVDYPGVLVGMVTIGVLGWSTAAAVELLGRRVTRWLPARQTEAGR